MCLVIFNINFVLYSFYLTFKLLHFNRQELSQSMKDEWHLADSGFNYNLVAVFGSQSTGKSKPNIFFDEEFDTYFDINSSIFFRYFVKSTFWY